MDIINTTRPATFGAATTTIVSNLFGGFANQMIAAYKANRTRKALSALTPRQLEDIGLTQSDIARVSRPTTLLR